MVIQGKGYANANWRSIDAFLPNHSFVQRPDVLTITNIAREDNQNTYQCVYLNTSPSFNSRVVTIYVNGSNGTQLHTIAMYN